MQDQSWSNWRRNQELTAQLCHPLKPTDHESPWPGNRMTKNASITQQKNTAALLNLQWSFNWMRSCKFHDIQRQTGAGQDRWFGLTCLKCILKLCTSLFWSALFGTALRDVRAGRITPLAQQYQLYYLPNAKFQLNPTDQLWMEDIALSLPWSL